MGRLSTHVLDTAQGMPGQGISIKLFSLHGDRHLVASSMTNSDGRTDEPLLNEETFRAGTYELEFSIGAYFRGTDLPQAEPPFLDDVVIRVSLVDGKTIMCRYWYPPGAIPPTEGPEFDEWQRGGKSKRRYSLYS